MGIRFAVGCLLLVGCAATPAARRYVVVAPDDGRGITRADCHAICGSFAKAGEAATCEPSALSKTLEQQLGADSAVVCIVHASEAR